MALPTWFISHGGGPWPWLTGPMRAAHLALEASLREMPRQIGPAPRAVLMVSAHWEAKDFMVMASERPAMLYDYSGFPENTYRVQYPAPGLPALAREVQSLARSAGLACGLDERRGFDHGAFAPLSIIYPRADVPVVQLSLKQGLDPAEHLALGRALAPLREQGVSIIGSGLSYHNMGLRGPGVKTSSKTFDDWLGESLIGLPPAQRAERLTRWAEAPAARQAHPREEHLLPLMVALGAAGDDAAQRSYHDENFFGGGVVSSFRFGAAAGDAPLHD